MHAFGRTASISIILAGQILVAAAVAGSPDEDRIVCKSLALTATRLPSPRVCRTRAQWRALEREQEVDRTGQTLSREQVLSQPPRPGAPQ